MSKNNYMILYVNAKGTKPYQPTSRWCANAIYQINEFLHPKIKSKYIPDEILITKREFIKDNL